MSQQRQIAIVYRNPKRLMLKCNALPHASPATNEPSRSSTGSNSRRPTSEPSRTLSALTLILPQLEQKNPVTLAAVLLLVKQELENGDTYEAAHPLGIPYP